MAGMGNVKTVKKAYGGWKNCLHISNGIVEAVATLDVGPRIIRFGYAGGDNEFYENPAQIGTTGGEGWKIYGGHRLWHSPECDPRTYAPDNEKITWERVRNGVKLLQPVESLTGLRKTMIMALSPDRAAARVEHRLTNEGQWEIELAAWALSVMAPGGRQVIPENTEDTGLLPNRSLTLWPYTRMNDPRLTWGSRYIFLDQDPEAKGPVKIGLPLEKGWAAYANRGRLFVKAAGYCNCGECHYPDNGCSYETYTNDCMMEMESLSPLVRLAPGETLIHEETWHLADRVPCPATEEEADREIAARVDALLKEDAFHA